MMKVLLINTSDKTGGAAIAASRLMVTLLKSGIDAHMLVAKSEGCHDARVSALPHGLRHKWNFLWERFVIFVKQNFTKTHLFDIDPAMTGSDITRLREFRDADVIHLHWVNQGFLSMKGLRQILESGKPVVWTLHDMWPFTGICHYVRNCVNYKGQCGNCPLLVHNGTWDLSHVVWERKQELWNQFPRLTFVACSKWLAETAQDSPLLKGHRVLDIVNPIDCDLYSVRNKTEARQTLGLPTDSKKLILFCAYNVTLPIKGLKYLKEALELLVERKPRLRNKLGVVLVGKGSEMAGADFCVDVFPMGFITDEKRKAQIYNAADLFVIPSLQDNLPNTIVEAKASGLPVIGTRVGGIPQMIDDGADGRLVNPEDSADLSKAMEWFLCEADADKVSALSRSNAVTQYSAEAVAAKYVECYKSLV